MTYAEKEKWQSIHLSEGGSFCTVALAIDLISFNFSMIFALFSSQKGLLLMERGGGKTL